MRLVVVKAMAGAATAALLAATCAPSSAPRMAATAHPSVAPPAATPAPSPTVADAFARDVAPLLAQRCAPCHKPGGSMYAKLPFDDPGTVRGHREGILRRLKGDDHATLTRWLDTAP